ncbi:MAG TPA: hypothetical protein VK463_02215 [Desulfomonilaceae bacterium]|nr:hypothetical protein [Desulfomonilaceae bacterium]
MKKLVLMLTLVTVVFSVPLAMARDASWDALMRTWNAQLAEQKAAEKKASVDQDQKSLTVTVQTPAPAAAKTK